MEWAAIAAAGNLGSGAPGIDQGLFSGDMLEGVELGVVRSDLGQGRLGQGYRIELTRPNLCCNAKDGVCGSVCGQGIWCRQRWWQP